MIIIARRIKSTRKLRGGGSGDKTHRKFARKAKRERHIIQEEEKIKGAKGIQGSLARNDVPLYYHRQIELARARGDIHAG